jgi:hypothetical protein
MSPSTSAAHELAHEIRLALLLADVVDRDDVGVVAEPAHGLSLALDAEEALVVEPIGLDQGEGHLPVELRVVGQVDALLAALAEEALDLVAAVAEGGGRCLRGRTARAPFRRSRRL